MWIDCSTTMNNGISTTTIQPPSVNFVTTWMIVTIAVATAPTPFSVARQRQPGPRLCAQCTTIPAWDRVKQTKTPMAYSGMRAFVLPWNNDKSTIATRASAMMPLEKPRRSPRAAS